MTARTSIRPADGAEVVLALAGSGRRRRRVGCTLDGPIFMVGTIDSVSDDELEAVLAEASTQWNVVELVVAPRMRPNLVHRLSRHDVPDSCVAEPG